MEDNMGGFMSPEEQEQYKGEITNYVENAPENASNSNYNYDNWGSYKAPTYESDFEKQQQEKYSGSENTGQESGQSKNPLANPNEGTIKHPNLLKNLQQDSDSQLSTTGSRGVGEPSEDDKYVSDIFSIPKWGVKEFLNERVNWQKQTDILVGEKGWFYFKIFFKFDTGYGLLGNVLKDKGKEYAPISSAAKYLYTISGGTNKGGTHKYGRYLAENVQSRLLLLQRFVKSLSFISSQAPWFFKKITNLQSFNMDFNDLSKEQVIEIECAEEAVDMRLGNLMDLYRTAAFDNNLQKEIIPHNLRKFDMSVMLLHLPVKYFQTALETLTKGKFKFKSTYDQDLSNLMSFKLFTFVGCEFDLQSMCDYYSAEMNNESPFEMGKTKIKIKYDRCYQHRMDEWNHILYGDNGVYYSESNNIDHDKSLSDMPNVVGNSKQGILKNWNDRIEAIEYAIDNRRYFNRKSEIYKALIDASEGLLQNAMMVVDDSSAFGNMYDGSHNKNALNTVTSLVGKRINNNNILKATLENINDHIIHGNISGPYPTISKEEYYEEIARMVKRVKHGPPSIVARGRDLDEKEQIKQTVTNLNSNNKIHKVNNNNETNKIGKTVNDKLTDLIKRKGKR